MSLHSGHTQIEHEILTPADLRIHPDPEAVYEIAPVQLYSTALHSNNPPDLSIIKDANSSRSITQSDSMSPFLDTISPTTR